MLLLLRLIKTTVANNTRFYDFFMTDKFFFMVNDVMVKLNDLLVGVFLERDISMNESWLSTICKIQPRQLS